MDKILKPLPIEHTKGNDLSKADNIDYKTVLSFGEEWQAFHDFSDEEIEKIGDEYFDLINFSKQKFKNAIEIGCGSGRWLKYLSNRVDRLTGVDPSDAIAVASQLCAGNENIRLIKSDVQGLDLKNEKFDLVYCLGVLHHIPDTQRAVKKIYSLLSDGGTFVFYLYYSLDNKGSLYRLIFQSSNLIRKVVSILPKTLKEIACNILFGSIYLPFVTAAKVLKRFNLPFAQIPLSYYADKSFYIARNDCRDRFGTPLEKRYSKQEIKEMLEKEGFMNIKFSEKTPYWHGTAIK